MTNLTIFDVNGNPILTPSVTKDAIWTRELMKSNFISLSFRLAEEAVT